MPNQGRNRGQITATGNTALTAGQIALGVGWGADSTVAIGTGANDVAGQVVITTVVGGGAMAQATATVTITFATPYAVAPRVVIADDYNTNDVGTGGFVKAVATTTTLTLTYGILPVTAKVYTLKWICVA